MNEDIEYDPFPRASTSLARRISWAAIFAGLIITLVVELLLSVLGISIGASAINPLTQQNPAEGVTMCAAIWLLVITLIALFTGSWVAGRMSGFARGGEGALHGLVTWGAATLLTVYLFSSALSGMMSGTANFISKAAPAMGAEGAAGALGGSWDSIREEALGLPREGAESASPAQSAQLIAALDRMFAQGRDGNVRPEDRDAVINILTSNYGMSREQANVKVDRWIGDYKQMRAEAGPRTRELGAKAAHGVSIAGWWSFIVLVLSALASAWGGAAGARAFLRSRAEIPIAP